jgi:hypothetical protein
MRYIAGISTGQVKRVADHALASVAQQPAEPTHIENGDYLYTSQERVQKLEKSNQMLLEALKEIEWSNDSAWQQDRARAAIAQAEKGATP